MGGLETTLLQAYAAQARPTTVLAAAMSAREGQRPAQGEPAAAHAIARCLDSLARATVAYGGRVVRRQELELMAVFPSADAAALAAAQVQDEVHRLERDLGVGIRAAFHSGAVRQRGYDVFGDTVILATELACRAKPGQILMSGETAASLGDGLGEAVRPLPLQARVGAVPVSELDWRGVAASGRAIGVAGRQPALRLTYRYNTVLRRREGDTLTIGRDPDCDLCVDVRLASRRHCTIERRKDKLLLRDHSTNGTFVTVDGERELRIRTEEIVLLGRGWLSFGASRLLAEEIVEFRCE